MTVISRRFTVQKRDNIQFKCVTAYCDRPWGSGQTAWVAQRVPLDVDKAFASAMAQKIHDHCFGEQFAAHYQQGGIQAEGSVERGATFYFTLVADDVGG
ncbi:MAG: hypothetical protein DSM106950_15150 [Stigonema ocellatum SAG 48.90 = DSM 106950]|nr:hypothetical protein [Stigonema ocellatum SAG 48.90 = DSM 106950]